MLTILTLGLRNEIHNFVGLWITASIHACLFAPGRLFAPLTITAVYMKAFKNLQCSHIKMSLVFKNLKFLLD
jgi:hypothetical protein